MKIYKHIIFTSFLFFVFSISLNAQSISGIINDSEGLPLPGATIQNLNTLDGVSTDFDGKFNIDASLDDVLEISFIGFETFQLKISNLSDDFTIQLELGNELDEVVVSSFGFEKKTKALGYSVTQVEGDEMSRVKSTNPLQALRGKVAGVNISNNASGIKGSTRVVIRGSSSFNGSNQPLYIIDGISIQNEQLGTAGEWGGIDGGDGLSTINPDDIKSISVLKGGAAAALYGSRASNGVILITTKDGGLERQGLGVEISNQTIFTQINDNFNPQMSYGNGLLGVASTNSLDPFNSWGPKLSSGTKLYDNMNTLYDTGLAMTNSVAFTSNTEKGSTRVSFTNLEASDVIDTSELKRNSLNLTTVQNLSDKLTVKASIKYNETREKGNVVMGTSPASPNETIRNFTPEIDVRDYLGEFGNGTTDGINELLPSTSIYSTNPWFAKNNNPISVYRDRLLASTSIQYNINEYLYAKLQAGFDRNTNHFNNTTGQGGNLNFPGISFFPKGDLYQQTQTIKQHDADFFIGTNGINITNDFSFNGFIGTGTFAFESEAVGVLGRNTVIPGLLTIQNTENQAALYQYGKKQINSTYANAEFDYQDKIFLTVTARNDWFSTLSAVGKETPNNDLYGSASLSVILSDLVELPSFLSFAKLRGGFSQVAGGAGNPYSLSLTYGLIGQGHLGSPLGAINGGNIPNVTITPFQKDETEIGLDMKMFNNKLSLDIAYYENKTTGDIVNAATSRASGYTATTINLGEMTNQGVEILLRGTVIDKGIWSEKVKKKIYVLGNRLGSSSMYAPDPSFFNVHKIKKKNYSDYNVTKVLEVECDNISNSLNELKIENLDYLKIDTQGSEFEILKGIGNYRPLLIKIEVHLYSMYKSAPGWDKLISYLYDLGYMIVDWKGIGSHATRTPAEMDMVFIPNFNSSFGKKLITANKEKFISLMLIFGQINLLKIISEKYHFKDSDEIQMIEDRYFN